jgi:hypothetical protein
MVVALGALLVPFVVLSAAASSAAVIDSGGSYLLLAGHSGKALEVAGSSTADGTAVSTFARNGGTHQQWRLTLTGGYYTIANVNSGKVLDVAASSTADGGIVNQWTAHGGGNQQWSIVDATASTVKVVNRASGKALDVTGRSTADGAPVVQWTDNGGTNQQWTLVPVGGPVNPGTPGPSTPGPAAPTGPYTWRNAEIVGGGFVTGLVFNATARDVLYARTDMGGAYRWDAGARRWVALTDFAGPDDWNLLGIESMASDPVDPNRLYVAAGTYTNDWAGNGAILRSTNQGRSFERTNMPFKFGGNEDGRSMGERLVVDPNRNGTLYLGTRKNGLWRSTDFGATWSQVGGFPVGGGASSGTGIGWVTFDPRSGSAGSGSRTIYAGVADSGTSVYRSTDAGASWQAVPNQPRGQLPHHGLLTADGTLYLTYGNGPGPNGMTAGSVWKVNTATNAWTNITPANAAHGYAGLSVDRQRPNTVMVSTMDRWWPSDEIYRSTNGGGSWTAITPRGTWNSAAAPWVGNRIGHWIGDLEIDPFNSDRVMYVTGAGIWGSDNVTAADSGGTTNWTIRAQGLEQTAIIDLIAPPGGAEVISAMGDIMGFRHDDITRLPTAQISSVFGNTTGIDFAEAAPSIMVRTSNSAPTGAFSTNGGTSWTPFPSTPGGAQAGSIAASADGATWVWTPAGQAPSVTRDRGGSWTGVRGLPTGAKVVADRARAGTFYALAGGTLYASTDAAASFTARASGLAQGHLEAVFGREGDLWIAAGGSGLFRSTNGGASFTRIGSGIGTALRIGFGRAAPGQSVPAVYLTGRVNNVWGVFRSDNGGGGWTRVNDDQHQFGSLNSAITGDPDRYGRVYLGTNGRGVQVGDPS